MPKIKNQKFILLAALVVGLMIIVFGPVLSRLKERLSTSRSLKAESAKLTEKRDALRGIDEVQVSERVEKMEAVFPSQKPVVQLISNLSRLSGNHNLTFGGVTLRPGTISQSEADKGALEDLSFGFTVGGSFADISLFLRDLEKVAPLMKIDEVSLAIKNNPLFDENLTIVTADISVSAYFQPPPKSLGAITAPVKLLSREDEAVLNELFNFISFETVLPTVPTGNPQLFGVGL